MGEQIPASVRFDPPVQEPELRHLYTQTGTDLFRCHGCQEHMTFVSLQPHALKWHDTRRYIIKV